MGSVLSRGSRINSKIVENLAKEMNELKDNSTILKDDLRCLKAKIGHVKNSTDIFGSLISNMQGNITSNTSSGNLHGTGSYTETEIFLNVTEKVDHQIEDYSSNPLLNIVILQGILSMLDHESVLNSRLVCSIWNVVAVNTLSKTSKVICSDSTLEQFDSVLSKAPSGLFQEAWLKHYHLDQPECQVLIADYGINLKALKIDSGPLDIRQLHSILTSWCLNLESLDYDEIRKPSLDIDGISENFQLPKPLKLKSTTLAGTNPDENMDGFSVQPLITILKASPKLEHLRICTGYSDFEAIFSGVKNIPHIAIKLRSIRIDTFYKTCFASTIPLKYLRHHPIIEANFGTEIRKLTLLHSISLEWLPQLLGKFKETLETVILYGYDSEEGEIQYLSYPHIPCPVTEFPKLEKIKTFKNFSRSTFPMTSINFVKYMDNLETLVLSGTGKGGLGGRQIDELFKECVFLQTNPHLKLKSLTLIGKITAIKTFNKIRTVFPNIINLHIELGSGESDWTFSSDKQAWIQEAIRQISMISSLQSLHLKFKKHSIPEADTFLYLRNMKFLEYLFIERSEKDENVFPADVEEILCKVQNLRSVTLIGFMMLLTDAKTLIESMAKCKIRLEFLDSFAIPECEVC